GKLVDFYRISRPTGWRGKKGKGLGNISRKIDFVNGRGTAKIKSGSERESVECSANTTRQITKPRSISARRFPCIPSSR
ncbi:hypothetical protein K0M31_010106, partial [Melipona bicolor]